MTTKEVQGAKVEFLRPCRAMVTTGTGVYEADFWAKPVPSRKMDWAWMRAGNDGEPYDGFGETIEEVVEGILEWENENL